jgi:hypothetical protein
MNTYKGQRKNFTGSVGPQSATKQVIEIVDIFELFLNSELVDKIVEETNTYTKQFLRGCKLSNRSTTRAWKPVTKEEIYVGLGLSMLMGIFQKPTMRSYFTTKRVISTPGFGDIITREREWNYVVNFCILLTIKPLIVFKYQKNFSKFSLYFTSK